MKTAALSYRAVRLFAVPSSDKVGFRFDLIAITQHQPTPTMMNHRTYYFALFYCAVGLALLTAPRATAGARLVSGQPEIVTDQAAYLPGSTATIIGSDFFPGEELELQVVHADATTGKRAEHAPWIVRANINGDFISTWQVCDDDKAGPQLTVVVTGLKSGLTAHVGFNYAAQILSKGDASQIQGWFNISNVWGGTLNGSNSKYGDGDVIPLRFSASLSPGSKHTVMLKYDFSSGGTQRFFDSIGSYNTTVSGAPLTSGFSNLGNSVLVAIPVDSSLPAGAQSPGVATAYGVSSITFGSYTLNNGQKWLPVTFTVTSGGNANKTVLLGYGAHLAGQTPWGTGNGASSFPGASQKAYVSLDGASDLNLSVNPGSIVPQADLGIAKLASPEPVVSGNNLTYTLTVQNFGPDAASGAVVQDTLPAGVSYVSATASQGTVSAANNAVSVALGGLNPGSFATISIVVRVTATTGTIANTATVSAATYDSKSANNTATISSTLKDTVLPAIVCPADITQAAAPGLCSAVVTYTASASDNSGSVSLSFNPASGSTFSKGTTTVTATATDPSGNSSTCTFKVTVIDTQVPTIACPANVLVNNDLGQCSAKVTFSVGVSDNCPGATVSSDPPSGYAFPVGVTTVQCLATDASGNTSPCSFTVTVQDKEAPVIANISDIILSSDAGRCDAKVTFPSPSAIDNCGGVVNFVFTPPSGTVFPIGTNVVTCTVTDLAGNSSSTLFSVIVLDAGNQSWPQAMGLSLVDHLGLQQASMQQCLTALDQSRWFRFKVQPGSRVYITLTDLAENYDLVLFKDIASAFNELIIGSDLTKVSASVASDAFSSAAFSPEAFAPGAFAPGAFAPGAFAPGAFAPGAFAPGAFAPGAFAPGAFAPDAFAPGAFAPGAFAPGAFAPGAFAPGAFAPGAFAPGAFAAAQIISVLAASAFDGIANEGIIANTWDSDDYYYVRIRGRNGVYSPGNPFTLTVYQQTGACGTVSPVALDSNGSPLPTPTTAAPAANYQTVILTDLNRWLGSGPSADKAMIQSKLAALAARPEVQGVVVDVGSDPWVNFFNAQADANYGCPYAKNLAAGAIKGIVDRSRNGNQLQYVVIVGNDSILPFFRYPDEALLGPERNYVPPVKDASASQASLRLGYVLNQDAYGAQCDLSLKSLTLPLPDLAVGRLVETPAEVASMVDAYLSTTGGVASNPSSALVTGYDFLADDAQAVANEFQLGMASAPQTLISPNTLPPSLCWTADNLRQALFGTRHDVIFLAGHFSASGALAADYTTHVLASEFEASSTDYKNTIIFSAGCHSGYNIVDADSITYFTLEPDWAQACARKQATLIAGTGYQYGDTDFIEYSERLYLNFAQQLRTGNGPVSVGKALIKAKQVYLAATPQMRPIHTKSYLEATLFGLPMLSVNFTGARRTDNVTTPLAVNTQPAPSNPGAALGLSYADVTINPVLTPTQVPLTKTDDSSTIMATYIAGGDGIINNPAEPILPLEVRNTAVNGTTLRGVGFRSGLYSELLNKVPLTGAAATEIRGVHAAFLSEVFYPIRPWSVNYFGALCGLGDGATRLIVTPAQFKSDSPVTSTGTFRLFSRMDFRLFYSANLQSYPTPDGQTTTPGLAAAPSISGVLGITRPTGTAVDFSAHVVGDPNAGIQSVWLTYTAGNGVWFGRWQSLDLTQDANDSTLWRGTLALPTGIFSDSVRYVVQAVNGVGGVTLDSKLGAFHVPDEFDAGSTANLADTSVQLLNPAATGAYDTSLPVSAKLTTQTGTALVGARLVFRLGDYELWGITGSDGVAIASLPLRSIPGNYDLKVSFAGATGLAPSYDVSPFSLTRQTTSITMQPTLVYVKPNTDTRIVATLTDAAAHLIMERTVVFVLTGANGSFAKPVITDLSGRAPLETLPLPAGTYNVVAYFNGTIPLPNQTITIEDGRYVPSTTAGILNVQLVVDGSLPTIQTPGNITQSTDPGLCSAVVNYSATAGDNNPGVQLVCTPASGSVFAKGTTTVNCVATDSAGNTLSSSFQVTVVDAQSPSITCPGNITVNADATKSTAAVNFSVTATDNCPGVQVVSVPASGSTFPMGTTTVNSTATDASGNTSACSFIVTVRDTQAPVISSVSASPNVLSPPNHTMVLVTISVFATDNAGPVTWQITTVSSSDPSNTAGDGNTSGDWMINSDRKTVYLRAERTSAGKGRTYTITVQATDSAGNKSTGTTTVFVPSN